MRGVVASGLVVAGLLAGPAAAHFPHDVVKEVGVSPAFDRDGVVLAAIQLTEHKLLARSTDGGRTWAQLGRIVAEKDVQGFAFSPDWERDATVFAATRRGGVFKSVDGGLEWTAVNDGLGCLNAGAVTCSASFAEDGVVVAATKDGVFRSTDAGESWSEVQAGAGHAWTCATAPGTGEMFVGRGGTLFRSTDAGATWDPLPGFGDRITSVATSPRFPEDETLAVCLARTGVRVSTDGGLTWARMNDGLNPPFRAKRVAIAADGTFFCVTMAAACLRADAALEEWTLFDEGFESPAEQTDDHYHSVAVSPTFARDGVVFVGAHEGLFVSGDRGESWIQSNLYHQRINRLLAISPAYADDGLVFVGNYGGGPMLWDETEGAWSARANGIGSLYCGVLAPSPAFAEDRTIFYGYMGTWRSTDGGTRWDPVTPYGTITRSIAFSPAFADDGLVLLNRAPAGTSRSTDGGDTWSDVEGLPKGRVNELAISPGFPGDPVVYAAPAQEGLWVSSDGGESFRPIEGALDGRNVRALALSPSFERDGVILAGTVGHGLFLSEDRGATFARVDTPSGPEDTIESLDFSPAFAGDSVVYAVSLYDGVLLSVDGGRTFGPRDDGLPPDAARVVRVSPDFENDRTVYVSTHAWTYRSTNGGASWSRLPGFLRVDDHHHTIERTGTWTLSKQDGDFASATQSSEDPSATERFRFHGKSITWHARTDPQGGAAKVWVDGTFVQAIDLYSAEPAANQPVFTHTFDAPDWHVIEVRVTGQKNRESRGFFVFSDGYAYEF